MKTDDLLLFFESLKAKSETSVVSLICLDVPYTLIRMFINPLIPEWITSIDYDESVESDAVLIIYGSDSDLGPLIKQLVRHSKNIVMTSEKELLSDSELLNYFSEFLTQKINESIPNEQPN